MIEGNSSNLVHYEWNEEYNDYINRFEDWVDIEKIKSIQDLYDELHEWLGVSKKGRLFPSQKQMDFFSEYYKQGYYDVRTEYVSEEPSEEAYEYKSGSYYSPVSGEFRKFTPEKKYEVYSGFKTVSNMKFFGKYVGRVEMIRDKKTGRILGWHRNLTKDIYYGKKY